jgi:hypothetical protein
VLPKNQQLWLYEKEETLQRWSRMQTWTSFKKSAIWLKKSAS